MKQKIILCVTFIALSLGASAQYSRSVITKSDAGAVSEVIKEANKQTAIELETKELKKKQLKDSYDYWKHIVMLNANFSMRSPKVAPSYFTYGATYAYLKKAGFYVSFETNFGPVPTTHATPEYFLTGMGRVSRYSVLAGGMVSLGIPLYFHAGAGYAYFSEVLQTTDGEWLLKGYGNNNAALEVGLLGHYKNVALSLSVSMVLDNSAYLTDVGLKIGVGYCF